VDHVGRNVQCRFRGNEHNAAPLPLDHPLGIGTGQAHAGHYVHIEKALPDLVRCVEEVLRAVDANVVDQDVHLRQLRNQLRAPVGIADIGYHASYRCSRTGLLDGCDRSVYRRLASAVDDDVCTSLGKALGDGEANTHRGTGDKGSLGAQIDFHGMHLVEVMPAI